MAKRPKTAAAANRKAATTTPAEKALLKRRVRKYAAYGVVALVALGAGWGAMVYNRLYAGIPDLPETAELWESGRESSIEFLDLEGDVIAIRGPRYGRAVYIEELPAHVSQAFIAAEDKRFYEHDGADTQAMARAAWSNFSSGRTVSGASTITQQLVKNLILDSRQTFSRKAQEVRLARELEERLTKAEILELYLNRVYFGARAYGLGAATEVYFDKPPTDLTLAESSLLATLPKAPSRLALTGEGLEQAKNRQAYVLSEMVDAGFITQEEADAAREEEVTLAVQEDYDPQLGYVLDHATETLRTTIPGAPGDLIVTLTINPEKQAAVQAALAARIAEDGPELEASQVGAIVMAADGAVVAMVGGADYEISPFNRATQAKRQPGSAFKPFVYAAALQSGLDPYDVRFDEPYSVGDWTPQNYTKGAYLGPVTVSESLAKSLNTVAAQLGQEVTEDQIIAAARRFGIMSDMRPLPSIALGSQEVTLWELTRAYGAFMLQGKRLDPYLIARIETSRGDLLYERPEYEPAQVLTAQDARDMNAMLARVIFEGTGTGAKLPGWTIAGKTGTSQDWRDAWFIGYSSSYVAGVWVGNDDDTPMKEVTGGGFPASLWSDVMALAHEGERRRGLAGAEGIGRLSDEAERRIAYYRTLSSAFRDIGPSQYANAASD